MIRLKVLVIGARYCLSSDDRQRTFIHFADRITQNVDILRRVWCYQYGFALRFQIKEILPHTHNAVLVEIVHRLAENKQIEGTKLISTS